MQSTSTKLVRWVAPEVDRLKLNVDVFVFNGNSSFAVGLVLRNHKGEFIQAKNCRFTGEISVFEAEARGVLEALKWIQELQLSNVDVESDSMLTVNALTRGAESYLEVGNVLQECRAICSSNPGVSISYVKNQANKVAHMLARVPCMVNCSNVFWSPLSVLETVMYEANLI